MRKCSTKHYFSSLFFRFFQIYKSNYGNFLFLQARKDYILYFCVSIKKKKTDTDKTSGKL